MPLQSAGRTVWRFVRSPRTFFQEHSAATNLAVGFVVVLAFAVALAGSVASLGVMLAASTDETVTMDNPDRPPAQICAGFDDDPDSLVGDRCEEPETIDRDAGALLQEAANQYVPWTFVTVFLLWPVSGVALFAGARIAGGDGGFAETLAVAAWGVVPEFLRLAAGLVGLRYVLARTTFTGPFESYPDQLASALAPLEAPLLVVTLVVLAWQWLLLTAGIQETHELPRAVAAAVVGVLLAVWGVLFALQ